MKQYIILQMVLTQLIQSFAAQNRISSTSFGYSDTSIKKISVDYGYSTDGKLVWINEFSDRPYILATDPTTNLLYFFDFGIENDSRFFEGLKTGDTVRVYHHYPIQVTTITGVGSGVKLISEHANGGLTEAEIQFIASKGYTVRTD